MAASESPSRRALLGAGLGALVATIASALGRPQGAHAGDGVPIIGGADNEGAYTTVVTNKVNDSDVFRGVSTSGSGIVGLSTSSNGVKGVSDKGIGVHGRSNTEKGVYGYSNSGPGVYAYSGANHGVWGYSDGQGEYAGVYGEGESAGAYGVIGHNLAGQAGGILGSRRAGVQAYVPNIPGYSAFHAQAGDAADALRVDGRARFNRSGKASVPAGRSFVLVTVPGGLSAESLVLATPMVNRAGVYVQSAVPNAATGQVRINLNKVASSSASTPIAWIVLS